jgi:hypothetical protein
VAVPSDQSDLRVIDTKRLLAMHYDLNHERIRSAHTSATMEPDPNLRARIAEIEAEIERRAAEGDPALLGMAAKRLESDTALLPPTEPEWASTLTPEAISRFSNRDLEAAYKKAQSDLELHRKTYGEPSEIKDPTKIDIKRTAVVNWRTKAEQVLESLGGEMLRRGLQTSRLAHSARSDRPQRGRVGPGRAARQAIVGANANLSDEDICRRLDLEVIRPPEVWQGVSTWVQAYRSPLYRQKVHVILSKDRRATS